jgi:hypothetical protein
LKVRVRSRCNHRVGGASVGRINDEDTGSMPEVTLEGGTGGCGGIRACLYHNYM